ncbi:MAG: hypothetical protein ABIQ01_09690 [Pseudolysinimonas sp.]
MDEFLQYAGAWSTIVQAVVVVAAIAFSVTQVRQGARSRELSSLQDVFAGMHSVEAYERRDRVLGHASDVNDWTYAERIEARKEADHLQRIGFYIRHRFLRRRLVLEMYSLLIINLWRAEKTFVEAERMRMGAPLYSSDFEDLAVAAERYRKRRNLPVDGSYLIDQPSDPTTPADVIDAERPKPSRGKRRSASRPQTR